MRILVTGGSGFIGTHLVKALKGKGYFVIVVDKKAEKPIDILNEDSLDSAFSQFRPDAVVHLAAAKRGDQDAIYRNNVGGTLNVVGACKRFGVKRLLFASTSAVYGHDQQVEWADCRPTSAYGRSKLIGEHLVVAGGTPSIVFRLFNVYGTGGESVVNVLDSCLRTGDVFTVFNRGIMKRDFIPVEMVVSAMLYGLEHDAADLLGTVNVGTGCGFSVQELVDLARTCGSLAYVVEEKSKRVDTYHSVADISKGSLFLDLKRSRKQLEENLLKFWRRP